MDRLKAMRTFTSVVAKQSFTQAAEMLGVSRGYVSRHISELEAHLGAQLLRRNTRHVSLTDAGEEYYRSCCQILRDLDEAEQTAAGAQKIVAGSLKILSKRAFGELQLSSAVTDFCMLHPDIAVSIVLEDQTSKVHDLIREGFDLAIRLSPLPDSNLIARRVATAEWVTCASPGYLRRFKMPNHPRELADHNCLFHLHNSLPSQTSELNYIGPEGPISVRVAGKRSANSVIMLRDAALRGLGIATLPIYCLGDHLDMGKLVRILTSYRLEKRDVFAVYSPNPRLPRRVSEFIDFLVDRFRDGYANNQSLRTASTKVKRIA